MKRKWWKILLAVALIAGILLIAAANFLVSAALVPSCMEQLTAFENITRDSVDALVQTEDILDNYALALKNTEEWLSQVEYEELSQTSRDGYNLAARVFYQKEESHRWVLLLHGYTGWKEEMYPYAKIYWENGYQVLAPDMRCQGESEGDYIGMGYTDSQDNMLWLQYILSKDNEAEIVLAGQSMGAACALMMAGSRELSPQVKAVVSDCAYTDAYEMFAEKMEEWFHLPAFPLLNVSDMMVRLRAGYSLKEASALDGIQNSKVPVLIIHGTEDEMISVNMAYELYEHAACEKELLIVEGAGHAQACSKDPDRYYETIFTFLNRYL